MTNRNLRVRRGDEEPDFPSVMGRPPPSSKVLFADPLGVKDRSSPPRNGGANGSPPRNGGANGGPQLGGANGGANADDYNSLDSTLGPPPGAPRSGATGPPRGQKQNKLPQQQRDVDFLPQQQMNEDERPMEQLVSARVSRADENASWGSEVRNTIFGALLESGAKCCSMRDRSEAQLVHDEHMWSPR